MEERYGCSKRTKNRCGKLIIFALMALFVFGQYAPAQAANKTSDPITLNRTVYTLKKGKTIRLKATLNKAAGIPSGTKKLAVIWKSSNPKVASVSGNGKVTAKKNGKTTITARIKGTRIKASSRITVGVPVSRIKISGKPVSLKMGERFTLKTTISPKKASVKKLAYESSNPKVATVSKKGVIRAVSAGTAKIRVTAADGSGKKASCTVTVTESTVPAVPVSSVALNKTRLNLKQGGREQLVATVGPSNAANKSVKWESSNQAVAEVSNNGTVTAVTEGTAVITASAHNNVRASCPVTVEAVSGQPEEPEKPEQPEEPENPENPEQPEDSEKTLVVYFGTPVQERSGQVDGISSASRTAEGETYKGNTEYIAE